MAIQWSSSSGYFSVGVELKYAVIDGGARARITADYYVRSDGYGHGDNGWVLQRSGAITGDVPFNFSSGFGQTKQQHVRTDTVVKDLSFATPSTHHFVAWTKVWNGGQPSVNAHITLPQRRVLPPRPPKNAQVARVNDSTARISWETDADAIGAAQPWSQLAVERYQGSTKKWTRLTLLPATTKSWDDTTAPANEHLEYQVFSINGGGWSSPAWAGTFNTRPASPINVKAQKVPGGVQVTWEQPSKPLDGYIIGYSITDNGKHVGDVTGGSTLTFLHTNASTAEVHEYKVSARVNTPEALWSVPSLPSNRVALLAVPAAPIGVSPVGSTVTPPQVVLRWQHNPTDTTDQYKADLRHRVKGAASWTTVNISGNTQTHTINVNDGTYEWQVRTWGEYKSTEEAGASPWSPVFTFQVSTAPNVGVQSPRSGEEWPKSLVNVEWSYYQPRNIAQARAQVELLQGGQVIERASLSGRVTAHVFTTILTNETDYQVRVRALSGLSVWSEWATSDFRTNFPPPPTPDLNIVWDDDLGVHDVNIVNPAPVGDQPETVYNRLERSDDGGLTWRTVADEVPVGSSYIDRTAPLRKVLYRVTAFSALPSSASHEEEYTAETKAAWLSGGPGFLQSVKMLGESTHSRSQDKKDRELYQFAGRKFPVELSGPARDHELSLSFKLVVWQGGQPDDAALAVEEAFFALADQDAPHLYRCPCGLVKYGSVGGAGSSPSNGVHTLSCKLTEVDYE